MTKLQNQPAKPDIENMSRNEIELLLVEGRLSNDDIINLKKQLRWFDSKDRKKENKPMFIVGVISLIVMVITLIVAFLTLSATLK